MRTDEGAQAAICADRGIPDGDFRGDAAFLIFGSAGQKRAVDWHCADGQIVAAPGDQGGGNAIHKIIVTGGNSGCQPLLAVGVGGHCDLAHRVEGRVDGGEILLHDGLTAGPVRLLDCRLDVTDGLFTRQQPREGEEACLHDGVDPCSHARALGHFPRVDDKEPEPLVDDLFLNFTGELVPGFVGRIRAVEEERRASGGNFEDVHLLEQLELVTGDKGRLFDQVGRPDRPRAKSQMGDGDRPSFL